MAQKLDEVLKEFGQEVPGLLTASVVGMDGLAVAEHITDNKVKGDEISSQLTLLIKLVDTSVSKTPGDYVEDNLLSTEKTYTMLRFLPGKDFFLAVMVERKVANLGNLRLMSRVYSERLVKALPR
jgi:predicted regulator of Ras-like GTPase activity (Roadblock/LC7/MglB family)